MLFVTEIFHFLVQWRELPPHVWNMEVSAFGILPVGMLGSYVEQDEVAFLDLSIANEAQEVDSRLPDPLLSTRDPKILCASHSKYDIFPPSHGTFAK